MTKKRRDRSERRNLNSQESHDLGYYDLQSQADEDGWPYPDDDEETTENRMYRDRRPNDRRRK